MPPVEVPEAFQLWQSVLQAIQDHVPEQSFATWIRPLIPQRLESNSLTLAVPSQFHREWIESHYVANLEAVLADLRGEPIHVKLQVSSQPAATSAPPLPRVTAPRPVPESEFDSHLNHRYQFENFIEGNSNSFARAACLAVADVSRRCPWNPLLIYGGTGLGKTHLLQAIGNRAATRNKQHRVLYASSERFTQDFIRSLQTRHTTDFSHQYRSIDLLLVDDIQFFASKERTQIEFFHAFNTLYQKGKRIVLTADRPVSELAGFDKRLISRFDSGLVTNIEPPDYETRVAILMHRAETDGFPITRDVADFLSSTVTSNIRDLEGAYVTLTARCQLMRLPPTVELAHEVLRSRSGQNGFRPPAERILTVVADHFGLSPDVLRSKSRKKEIVVPRMIAMTLMAEMTSLSLKAIGSHFGGRDHSTVIHARDTILDRRNAGDEDIIRTLKTLRQKVNPLTHPSGLT
ncbi:chromosomal replication initiator protein DnaA [bacterium]|nr:chromosomal replication initiator protein DnaA [bacterium]MBU1983452.1 chromosomal replication initiator protein DnaA [bacterium]